MSTAAQAQGAAQARQKRNIDARARPLGQNIVPGSRVYVRKEYVNPHKQRKRKFSSIAEGPYEVTEANRSTIVIMNGVERLSRDRVVRAPATLQHAPSSIPSATSQSVDQTTLVSSSSPLDRLNSSLLDLPLGVTPELLRTVTRVTQPPTPASYPQDAPAHSPMPVLGYPVPSREREDCEGSQLLHRPQDLRQT